MSPAHPPVALAQQAANLLHASGGVADDVPAPATERAGSTANLRIAPTAIKTRETPNPVTHLGSLRQPYLNTPSRENKPRVCVQPSEAQRGLND